VPPEQVFKALHLPGGRARSAGQIASFCLRRVLRLLATAGSGASRMFPFLAHTHRAGIVAATADSGLVRAIRGQSSAERDQDPA